MAQGRLDHKPGVGGEIHSLTQSSIEEKGRCGARQPRASQDVWQRGLCPWSRGKLPVDRVFWAHLTAASHAQSSGAMQGHAGQEEPSAPDSC